MKIAVGVEHVLIISCQINLTYEENYKREVNNFPLGNYFLIGNNINSLKVSNKKQKTKTEGKFHIAI